jgi:hypothetical protein
MTTATATVAKKTITKTQAKKIFKQAYEAGMKAGNSVGVTPMIVGSPTTPLGNDIDYTKRTYFVEGGVCGFAWVKIKPARGNFVAYLKSLDKFPSNAWNGGYDYWVSEFGQSMQRKEAFAGAFADVLRGYGINAYAQSRMD